MDELRKIKRVVQKHDPYAPHEVLLVVDATTGGNALTQAVQFHEAIGLTGLVITKLDGTAKGRSEEHTSELQSLMRISYAVFCLKKTTISIYRNVSHFTHHKE